ncbi:MAG TPA: hypothetical protein VFN61_04530 [Acidimicrobiales bacterium]|nr:hypothetical protein [Acidimicrobiales bacterium]
MSIFKPNSAWAVVGVVLFLIALYLVLEHFGGASALLSTLFNGSTLLAGTLQGRKVTGGGGVSVG